MPNNTHSFLKNLSCFLTSRDFNDWMNTEMQYEGRPAITHVCCIISLYETNLLESRSSVAVSNGFYSTVLLYADASHSTYCPPVTTGIEWYTGFTNHGCPVTVVTKFCMVLPNICRFLVWNLLHVTFLSSSISEVAPRFLKNLCTPKPTSNMRRCFSNTI